MKLTKRMKSSLIQLGITNIFLFFIFIGIMLFSIVPQVRAIELQKEELVKTHSQLVDIQKNGISFNNIKGAIGKYNKQLDGSQTNLLNNIDEEFYNEFFISTGDIPYSEFLRDLEQAVATTKNSEEYKQKISLFNEILPYYNPKIKLENDSLSDSYFINYVEKILYTFNLQSQGDIGVGRIQKIESDSTIGEPLNEDVYKIPLDFKLTGRKTDMIEFIHFLENVGSINIEDNEVGVHTDDFTNKVLLNSSDSEDYNIYNHQVADIQTLSFQIYPDSSSVKSEKDFVTRLVTEQSREKIESDISINFYVSGLPEYRIQGYVSQFLLDFQKLSQSIILDATKYRASLYTYTEGTQIQAITTLESLAGLMNLLQEEVQEIRIQMNQGKSSEDLYSRVVDYNNRLEQIQNKYLQQIRLLTEK